MANIEKRETPDGKTSYRVKVRLKGYPPQSATFDRMSDAKKWAAATESAIREGRHFKTVEAKRHTVAEMINRYLEYELPRKGSQKDNQKSQLLWWREHIGVYLLSDTTPALIAECRDKLANEATHQSERRSPSTVNRYIAALSHVFTVAVNEWGWLDDSPMRKVNKLSEPTGRIRYLADDERERLLIACKESSSPFIYTVVVLALSTGMRKAEILNLYWKEPPIAPKETAWGVVHSDQARIVLHETKNGTRRVVPLGAHALAIIKEHAKVRRIESDLLFPGTDTQKPVDLRFPWLQVLAKSDIENFRFHDLRHSAASYLAMNGATPSELAEVLGHKTLQMVKRYSHLSDSHVSSVIERMNGKIFGAGA